MKHFSLKSVCGYYVLKHLKEHSAVVVKKEFRLRNAFNFLKTFTKRNTSMKAVPHYYTSGSFIVITHKNTWFLDREMHQLVTYVAISCSFSVKLLNVIL